MKEIPTFGRRFHQLRRDKLPPIWREAESVNPRGMTSKLLKKNAVDHVPDPHHPIFTAAGKILTVRAKSQPLDKALVFAEGNDLLSCVGFPDPDQAGPVGGCEPLVVGTEYDIIEDSAAVKLTLKLSKFDVPDPDPYPDGRDA